MPYRHAHFYLLLLAALTVLAFWPSYFSVLPNSPAAFHIHGFTASLWIALLSLQSWLIHHGAPEQHRAAGLASLVLFPFFAASNLLIVHSMATKFASAADPFNAQFGARLAALDLVATGAIGFLYWSGLRWRRKIHLHARYLLATVFFLFAPIFARLFGLYVPPLQLAPPDFAKLPLNVELASLCAGLLALALAWKSPKQAGPWLLTAGLIGVQMLLFVTLGVFGPWEGTVRAIAMIPAPLLFGAGLAAGVMISWLGWNAAPPRSSRRMQAV